MRGSARWVVLAAAAAVGAVAISYHLRPPAARLVGFALSTLQEERYQLDRRHFLEAARARGLGVLFTAADNDPSVQVNQVEDLLARGVRALVIQPCNGTAAAILVERAHARGVPVIAYDRAIRHPEVDCYVTQDSHEVGRLQAEAAVAFTRGQGRYVLCMGQEGHSVAREITRGYDDVLARHPAVRVVARQHHPTWGTAEAMATLENALVANAGQVDAVLCNNSGMALGAVRAIEAARLTGKVFVAGADATTVACRLAAEGRHAYYDVVKPIRPLAEAAVGLCARIVDGALAIEAGREDLGFGPIPVVKTRVLGFDRASIEEVVIRSGWKTRAEVFGERGQP